MKTVTKLRYLRYALIVAGIIFIFGIYPLMHFWPSGWRWAPPQAQYEQMIVGVYATLGVFLLIASKNPLNNRSLIWFTVWSSVVHATIMLLQIIQDPQQMHHIYGDIPALYIIAAALAFLLPPKPNKHEKV